MRATQFAEFADSITDSMTVGDEVRVPDALIQPIAADEVAADVARAAVAEPLNGVVNIGGPQKISFEQMARDVAGPRATTRPSSSTRRPSTSARRWTKRSLVTPD